MTRLLVHVEGQTEEDFVNEVLQSHLLRRGYRTVGARIIGNARLRRRRGGIRTWPSVKKDIINHLRQDPGCVATTMVDFYGLPQNGEGAWPGRAKARGKTVQEKAASVEDALLANVVAEMEGAFNSQRFVPFVVMHEFEGLLFSDCKSFGAGIGRPELEDSFRRIRIEFATPEDINDSPTTAPSKRVEELVPGYEKPFLGTLAMLEIGIDRLRSECHHFRSWLERLESLAG